MYVHDFSFFYIRFDFKLRLILFTILIFIIIINYYTLKFIVFIYFKVFKKSPIQRY